MNHNNDKPVRNNFLVFGQPKIEDDEIEVYVVKRFGTDYIKS